MGAESNPIVTWDPAHCWLVTGSLSYTTVGAVRTAFDPRAGTGPCRIDLHGVTNTDSAGVALLVDWARQADRVGRGIEFLNAPEQLRAIVGISGLADALLED